MPSSEFKPFDLSQIQGGTDTAAAVKAALKNDPSPRTTMVFTEGVDSPVVTRTPSSQAEANAMGARLVNSSAFQSIFGSATPADPAKKVRPT